MTSRTEILAGVFLSLSGEFRPQGEQALNGLRLWADLHLPSEVPKMVKKVSKSEGQWKQELTPEQFEVCRKKGTEKPFSGEYYDCKEKGIYQCVACGNDLFSSDTKFDSGTGWPSFWAPIAQENIKTEEDNSLFMRRVEVLCSRCDPLCQR